MMAGKGVKRSSVDRTGQASRPGQGVGGRQGSRAWPARGGGYLDICTLSGFDIGSKITRGRANYDPRLDELRAIGLAPRWLEIASTLGVDAFLRLWEILDKHAADENFRISIPRINSYIRYQRNRFILSLSACGLSPKDIRKQLEAQVGESISCRHISRLLAQSKKG